MAKQKWQDKYKGRTNAMIIDPYLKGDYIDEYEALKTIKNESKNSIAKIITSSNEQRKYYERIIKNLESKIESNEACLFN